MSALDSNLKTLRQDRQEAVRRAAEGRAHALKALHRAELILAEAIDLAYAAGLTTREISVLTGLKAKLLVSLVDQYKQRPDVPTARDTLDRRR